MKIIIPIIIILFAQNVLACNKAKYTFKESLIKSDIIFSGKITNLRYLDDIEQKKIEPRVIVTFETNKIWKGEETKEILLHTTHNKGSCNGFVFEAGKEYLVYAVVQKHANNFLANLFSKKEPTIGVKIYGGTKPLHEAENEIKKLNTSKNKKI